MPRPPHRPAALAGRLFLGSDAIARGLLSTSELRSSAWQPVLRGIYADASVALTHLHRCRAVSSFVLPPGGAIAGRSAAYLYSARLIADDAPVEVLVPAGDKVRLAGVRAHVAALDPDELRTRAGMPVTDPLRTCWDLANGWTWSRRSSWLTRWRPGRWCESPSWRSIPAREPAIAVGVAV
jgi:hypothetical protein